MIYINEYEDQNANVTEKENISQNQIILAIVIRDELDRRATSDSDSPAADAGAGAGAVALGLRNVDSLGLGYS